MRTKVESVQLNDIRPMRHWLTTGGLSVSNYALPNPDTRLSGGDASIDSWTTKRQQLAVSQSATCPLAGLVPCQSGTIVRPLRQR